MKAKILGAVVLVVTMIVATLALLSPNSAGAITTAHCDYLHNAGTTYSTSPNSDWGFTGLTQGYFNSANQFVQTATLTGFHDTWGNDAHPDNVQATFADGFISLQIYTTTVDSTTKTWALYTTHGKITALRACYRL